MIRRHWLVLSSLLVLAFACSDEDPPAGTRGGSTDAGSDSASTPSGGPDAATTDAGDASTASAGTLLEADINGVKRSLDRAEFGDERDDAGTQFLYAEAHFGGDPTCPATDGGGGTSPERTVIVGNVPRAAAGTSFTKADGVFVTFLDFTGDQIPTEPPFTKASALTVTIAAIDPAQTPAFVDLDVDATFPDGTVKGRIHATYCAVMSR